MFSRLNDMDELVVIDLAKETIILTLKLSLPLLLVALVVGFMISLLQALTQLQEPTMSFVPKIIAIFVTLLLLLPYIGTAMNDFAENIFSMMIHLQ